MTTLQQLISQVCAETEGSDYEVNFRNAYSGRGMYGAQCVGITGSRKACMQVIAQAIKDSYEESIRNEELDRDLLDRDLSVDTLLGFEQDSMGYDVILYWPGLSSIEDGDDFERAEEKELGY